MSGSSPVQVPHRVGAIWAQDRHGVIGADGHMLWRVPADFRHFRAATTGGVVIVGRTTWQSLGTALPGRLSVVLTRQQGWADDAVARVAPTLTAGLRRACELAAGLGEDPREGAYRALPRVWVIGGGSVYQQALEAGVIDELLVSVIDIDAVSAAARRGVALSRPVSAPHLEPGTWAPDPEHSDPEGTWRPVSGDAPWRVEHYRRR